MKRVLITGLTCVACLATGLFAADEAGAATPLVEIRVSPETTVTLGSTLLDDEKIARDDLAGTVTTVSIGAIPASADLDGYHLLSNGDQLLSFDTTVDLPGGVTARPGDVVRYNGSSYILAFDADAEGIPDGVNVDAVAMSGTSLLLSFDVTVSLGGLVIEDEDLVLFDGAAFSMFFDGSAAGVSRDLDLDAADAIDCNGHLLLSFDGSGAIGTLRFDDEDVLEYDRAGTWEMAYDGSAHFAALRATDLDALHATPSLGPPVVFGQTIVAAANKVQFTWPSSVSWRAVRGSFGSPAQIGAYAYSFSASGTGTVLADAATPAIGTGFWYLVKRGGCVNGSWQSSLGAEPGRDTSLP